MRVRPLDGAKPHDVIIREGEIFLLPRWVPHRPQRPATTVGLIVEFPRPAGQNDGLQWYCPKCDHLVYDARFRLKKIYKDLSIVMHKFWDGPAARRTCKNCGYVIQRAGTIAIDKGKVRAAGGARAAGKKKARRTSRGVKSRR